MVSKRLHPPPTWGLGTSAVTLALLARIRGVPPSHIAWEQGCLREQGLAGPAVSLQELVARAREAGLDAPACLEARAVLEETAPTYASGCNAAVVSVDIATGIVRVIDYAVTHDCGRIANPLLVDGQIVGGVVQGLGSALFEELRYDAAGRPLCAGFGDYVLPTAATVPDFRLRHLETPSPLNPLGMKGAGESGCTGSAAAIVNAIADALRPLDITLPTQGPLTPERIRALLRKSQPQEPSLC